MNEARLLGLQPGMYNCGLSLIALNKHVDKPEQPLYFNAKLLILNNAN